MTWNESPRQAVKRLLDECTDAKRLAGRTEAARVMAEKAYELATRDELPAPWPQLAAYRLAHLLLREGAGADLVRADTLLAEASGSGDGPAADVLGPMPRIYRLAVMHRLNAPEKQIRALYGKARESIRRFQSGIDYQGQRGSIQDCLFNMLELATYFLGIPYKLEGEGSAFSGLELGKNDWYLVASGENLSGIRMPGPLARSELESRARRSPDALVFVLEENRPRWRIARQSGWADANADQLRLVACLLLGGGAWSTINLHEHVLKTMEFKESRFRKVKQRLNESFVELGHDEKLVPDARGAGRQHQLLPGLPIIGAVSVDALNPQGQLVTSMSR
jgi:hypothetical protein